ncbi:winged helix-turn-helix domain-containing protein [Lysobacter fragariae]
MEGPGATISGPAGGECFRFGNVVLDASAHTLARDGQLQAVEPKAFAVLEFLLRHPGELVRHGDLLDAVWGHRHVTPGVLTRAIAQLRHVLDDDSQNPRYIQTQHGLGYRFVGELQPSLPVDAGTEPVPSVQAPATDAIAVASPAGDTHWVETDAPIAGDSVAASLSPESGATVATVAMSRRRRAWWRPSPIAALVLVVGIVLVASAAVWWASRERAGAPPAEATIAVLPFTSISNDSNDSYFAEGLAVELHDALAGIPGLKVAACRTDSVCGTRGADVRKLGRLLGVATVLDAEVRREGKRVRVSAHLTDTRTGYTVWSGSYDRELAGVFALQTQIAGEVVHSLLGDQPGSGDALARRLQPTRNVAAYDAYLKGLQRLSDRKEGTTAAIGFFNEALAADRGFARAQAGVCRAQIDAFTSGRDAAAFERAQTACKRAEQMDPALREVSLALGDLHQTRDEPAQALVHYRRALQDNALKPDAYLGMARAEAAQHHDDVALGYFERARQLRPGDATVYRSLGFHYYVGGNLPKAIETYRVATTLEPNDEETWASYGGLCLLNHDKACANDAFMRSLAIKPSSGALINLGVLRFDEGAYEESASLFRRATQLDPGDYRTWGNLGDALSATPATQAQAREPYQRAAQMAQAYVDLKPQDAHALAVLSWYRANLSQAQEARTLLARAESLGAEPGEVAYWGAQTLARLGDAAGARERIQRALAGDIGRERLSASPVLHPLLDSSTATQ